MQYETACVVDATTRREGAVSALVGQDPMSGDDASHAERVCGPSREPKYEGTAVVGDDAEEEFSARRRRREVDGQVPARDGHAPRGHGGIPGEEVRGSGV